MTAEENRQLSELLETMNKLRSSEGCPWDREQTPESLRPYILEEAYELVDAIDSGHTDEILAELGDLLLQVVFQAQIYSERGLFGIGEIAEGINRKLQRRHPHIFTAIKDPSRHPDWDQIKRLELQEKGKSTDFVSRQPVDLPALKLADKYCRYLQKTVPDRESVDASRPRSATCPEDWQEKDFAAALFDLVSQAQKKNIDCDIALRRHVLMLFGKQTGKDGDTRQSV